MKTPQLVDTYNATAPLLSKILMIRRRKVGKKRLQSDCSDEKNLLRTFQQALCPRLVALPPSVASARTTWWQTAPLGEERAATENGMLALLILSVYG